METVFVLRTDKFSVVTSAYLLKIIRPNMLKMGHKNQRKIEGPIRMTKGTRELLDKVEKLYKS